MKPSVLVGDFAQTAWVCVEGKGTFQNSLGVKEFSKQMIQKGFRKFIVDLKKCELMDSTFMGTLAGIALRLQEIGHGDMQVINVNDRNTDLLTNLGLDHLFEIQSPKHESPPCPQKKHLKKTEPQADSTRKSKAMHETVFTAHQALVEVQPENLNHFKDVLVYLEDEKSKNFPNT